MKKTNNFFIDKNYSDLNTQSQWQSTEQVITVKKVDGIITEVKPDLGNLECPRIYTIQSIDFTVDMLELYQVKKDKLPIKFKVSSGEPLGLSQNILRNPTWYGWYVLPYV